MENRWVNTSLRPRFFIFDGSFMIFILIFIFHIRLSTFAFLIVVATFYIVLRQARVTPLDFVLIIRSKISGKIKRNRKLRDTIAL